MVDLSTRYMGLSLKNPLVVASSSLTGTVDGVRRCAEAGAGAVVLKSLFEEQILAETGKMADSADGMYGGEGLEYLQGYGIELGPRDYLQLVQDAKRAVEIPVIASLNCVSSQRWADYAEKLQSAGADAIELNVALMPTDAGQSSEEVENRYYRVLHEVKSKVDIPVAMKIGPYFSSFAHFAQHLCADRQEAPPFTVGWCGPGETGGRIVWRGADALVLFNRFYQFDIDIDRLELKAGNPYSDSSEIHTPLRWISFLYGRVDADLAATTGIHTGQDAVKQLLAGAQVVQLCSTLYQHGLERIGEIRQQLSDWMQQKGFDSLDRFRGRLSRSHSDQPESFERLQYIKLFVGID
ncbi:dihydroorotate dehydrogenase (fumarate) [Geothermobacter ehrlichii]|uniref:Dihydroorotate dehydrogenase (Fumarate) n=1 Tax=Geothermobacter ehrlichii TaxID=213224 RepID=A0A5D3WIB7_9BACT|nr:dihydroorotate dehydrogenase-like protein [Geothermobacter ehrlichii]TYO98214.1 dihydroorotate dehydrogenase (fumarate) [Geothermobacter ehrlichii]